MNLALLLDLVTALLDDRSAATDVSRAISYAGLLRAAQRWAAWIAARSGGRPVLYVGSSRLEMVEILFGSAMAGSAFVPVNYRLKAIEIAACLRTADPGVVLLEGRYRHLVGDPPGVQVADVDAVVLPADALAEVADSAAPAVCLFTSGTTSAPKLAVLTHENLSSYVINTVEPGSAEAAEAVLISTPAYHIAWIANVLSNVYRGRRLVLRPQFDAREWLLTVRAEGVTHAMVVPTMLARILDVLEAEPALAPATLVNLAYGGARAPEGLVERAVRLLPPSVGLVNAFGLTETSSTIAMLGPEDHRAAFGSADPRVRTRLQSVGQPVPGVEIRIAREDGAEAAREELGQLWIRGPQVSPGYVGRPGVVDDQGWFRSGDRAYLDGAGYLFVTGRADDVIIRGGENIDPAEIEEVLERHPTVREAVVVGLPDPEWGQVLAALVVGDGAAAEDDLRAWVRSQLAGYKVPTRIRWVSALPRTETGKIVRRDARVLLEQPAQEVR